VTRSTKPASASVGAGEALWVATSSWFYPAAREGKAAGSDAGAARNGDLR